MCICKWHAAVMFLNFGLKLQLPRPKKSAQVYILPLKWSSECAFHSGQMDLNPVTIDIAFVPLYNFKADKIS